MKKLSIISHLSLFLVQSALAECVHEKIILGSKLIKESLGLSVFVETTDSIYAPLASIKINPKKMYTVQLFEKKIRTKSAGDYNSKYIEYYGYARMQKYLKDSADLIQKAGLETRVVGKSLLGRDLYAVTPVILLKKKTILMFGRHHGDEGTANWIIEGFFNEYLTNADFRNKYQLILYPMVNPDGAEAKSRYNSNNRDLNRSWNKDPSGDKDEIKVIHGDLRKFMNKVQSDIFVALDMHGSFRKDFIYRVKKNYVTRDFYNLQQNFIDELGAYDPWQNGNYELSNGDPGMARLVLINHYKKNAMTHESIRDIKKNNSSGRTKKTLMDQGLAVIKSIENLW
jgi:hypothetical protein